jgi:hypothetical protein
MQNDKDVVAVILPSLKLFTEFLFQQNFKIKKPLIFYLYILYHLSLNKWTKYVFTQVSE